MASRGQGASELNKRRKKRLQEEQEKSSSPPRSGRAATRRRELEGRAAASGSSSGGVAGRSRGTGAVGTGPASRKPGNPRNALPPRVSGSKGTGGFRKATAADIGSGSAAPRLPANGAASKPSPNKVDPAAEFDRQFAAARKKLGPGKTFTYTGPGPRNGKKFTTDRADDKPKPSNNTPAKKAASKKKGFFDRIGEGFKKATARTGKPNKRRFTRGARMTPGEKRKYEAAMKRWEEGQRKAQEESSKKSAGGRVMMKKAAAKKAAAKKAAKKKAVRRP